MTALLAFLAVLDIEAFAALTWVFFTRSEPGRAVFLWLSPERLILAVLLLVVFIGLVILALRLKRDRGGAQKLLRRADAFLIDRHQLVPAHAALLVPALAIAAAAGVVLTTPLEYSAYQQLSPQTFPLLHSLTLVLLPVLSLVVLALLQASGFLLVRYPGALRSPRAWQWADIAPGLLLLVITLATAFHWLVLIFQLRFFINIPGWYWIFAPVPFGLGDVIYALVALAHLSLAWWLLSVRNRIKLGLLAVFALAWFLQMGIGLMGGGGITTLRDRYFTTYHQAYVARAAASQGSLLENVQRYDALQGDNTFTTTKPPGLMAFYIGLDHLVNAFPSPYSDAVRYARLSALVVWLFPLLAAATPVLVWMFARRFLDGSSARMAPAAALLYALAPSVASFTFFPDQALYPALFILGVWLTVEVIRNGQISRAVGLGAVLYAAAFFSYALLLLYVFAGLYLMLHIWKSAPKGRLSRLVQFGVGLTVGTLVAYVLGALWFNYDFLAHFQRMATINHNFDFYLRVGAQPPAAPEPLLIRLGQIVRAAWLNNLDFAAAIGFPVYLLFAVNALRRLPAFRGPALASGLQVLLALLASFVVLNLAGTAQGEVPRLWLFWLPMVALFAALQLKPALERQPRLMLLVGGAQILTTMLTFHFQDLRM